MFYARDTNLHENFVSNKADYYYFFSVARSVTFYFMVTKENINICIHVISVNDPMEVISGWYKIIFSLREY